MKTKPDQPKKKPSARQPAKGGRRPPTGYATMETVWDLICAVENLTSCLKQGPMWGSSGVAADRLNAAWCAIDRARKSHSVPDQATAKSKL